MSVINLRLATEPGVDIDASRAAAQAAGLKYIYLPFDVENPDPQLFDNLQVAFDDKANQPVYIHCASANRVAFLWMIKRVLEDGWEIDKAEEEAEAIGLKGPQGKEAAIKYINAHRPPAVPSGAANTAPPPPASAPAPPEKPSAATPPEKTSPVAPPEKASTEASAEKPRAATPTEKKSLGMAGMSGRPNQ